MCFLCSAEGATLRFAAPRLASLLVTMTPARHSGIRHIARHGRMRRQNASGCNKRARVEAAMNGWQQVIGGKSRAHTDECRATKAAVAVGVLNRMLDLRRPSHARVA